MKPFNSSNIVGWARPSEWIPLKCSRCGAVFTTKNQKYVGYNDIHLGHTTGDAYPYEKAIKCKHQAKMLRPDLDTYQGGEW